MQQGNGSMAQPMLHQQQQQQSQHGFAPQGFQPRSQEHMPGKELLQAMSPSSGQVVLTHPSTCLLTHLS